MIEVNGLVKRFDGFAALDGAALSVPAGSVYGLVGPNGAGKSTLIRHLTGIFRQDAGTVRITFDMNVRAAVDGFDVFDRSLPTLPVLEPGKLVMEVKFTEFLPQIVRDILPGKAQEITAASKYVLCYDKASYLRGFDYWQEGWNVPSV